LTTDATTIHTSPIDQPPSKILLPVLI